MSKEISINNHGKAVVAEYSDQILEEYNGNPLIEALPPIYSQEQVEAWLHVYPKYNPKERELDEQYRYHCVMRIFRYFQPMKKHFDLEQRISRVIRQGYISRNPLKPAYASSLQEVYKAVKRGDYEFSECDFADTTASGFTMIGISGIGKSTAIKRILSMYPQIIMHDRYKGEELSQYQLVWLKLDCPFDGSVKGLCTNFFVEFDKLLGENSYHKFASGRNTSVNSMIPRMSQLAMRHSLGVLIIDEIQHLSLAKSGGSEKMLNFFVNLVNTLGVPVILIGTTKAMSILQSEFRQARRGSGQGDMMWDKMKKDGYWDLLLEGMWEYQWTRKENPFTPELSDVIYEESQGIVDIAVKLYAMAQMRAIATGKEIITPKLIQQVAKDSLKLVKPMLDALKSGNLELIKKYDDIRPLDIEAFKQETENLLSTNQKIEQKRTLAEQKRQQKHSVFEEAVLKLLEFDISPEKAKKLVEKVMESHKDASASFVAMEAMMLWHQENQKTNEKPVEKKGRKGKPSDPDDLRVIVEEGRKNGKTAHDALKEKGYICNPVEEFIKIG